MQKIDVYMSALNLLSFKPSNNEFNFRLSDGSVSFDLLMYRMAIMANGQMIIIERRTILVTVLRFS